MSSDDKSKNIFRVKLQKLEDELVAARKVSSERQLAVTDVCALHLLAAYLCKMQLESWNGLSDENVIYAALQAFSSTSRLQ